MITQMMMMVMMLMMAVPVTELSSSFTMRGILCVSMPPVPASDCWPIGPSPHSSVVYRTMNSPALVGSPDKSGCVVGSECVCVSVCECV